MTDYRPAIHDLGLEPWLAATVGLEVTTIELPVSSPHGPFCAGRRRLQWDGLEPQEMIDGIRQLGAPDESGREPVVFVGVPETESSVTSTSTASPTTKYRMGGPLVQPLLNALADNPLLYPERFSTTTH